jgi:hypothetical protein
LPSNRPLVSANEQRLSVKFYFTLGNDHEQYRNCEGFNAYAELARAALGAESG